MHVGLNKLTNVTSSTRPSMSGIRTGVSGMGGGRALVLLDEGKEF